MKKIQRDFKTEKPFYLRDLVAVAMVLAVLIASIVMLTMKKGGTVEVYVDGKLKYSYSLSENRTFEVTSDEGKNVVEIKNGQVKVIDADCKNHACVKSKAISKKGEQIVCLPHKLIVVIKGGSEGELDART